MSPIIALCRPGRETGTTRENEDRDVHLRGVGLTRVATVHRNPIRGARASHKGPSRAVSS